MKQRRLKLQPTGADALSDRLERHLQKKNRRSIVIPTAEGWRHSSPEIDLSRSEIRELSRTLTRSSLKRIRTMNLSPAETRFFESQVKDEL